MLSEKVHGMRNLGVRHVLREVYAERGLKGLFAGVLPRMAWMSFGGFIFLGAFELVRDLLIYSGPSGNGFESEFESGPRSESEFEAERQKRFFWQGSQNFWAEKFWDWVARQFYGDDPWEGRPKTWDEVRKEAYKFDEREKSMFEEKRRAT